MTFSSIGVAFVLAGAAGGNAQAASAGVAPIALMMMLLGGFYINTSTIPVWINWLSKLDYMNWVFKGLAINEFNDDVVLAHNVPSSVTDGSACSPAARLDQCLNGTSVLDF